MSKNTHKCHKISLTKLVYAKHGEMGYYYHLTILIYNTCVDGHSGVIFAICFLLIDDA